MYRLRTISIKTQVRRLKLFTVLLDSVNQRGSQIGFLANKMINWSEAHHNDLESYPSPTGEIIKSKVSRPRRRTSGVAISAISTSFRNYLEAAQSFQLVDEQLGTISPSRIGSVLKALKKFSHARHSPNAYSLTDFEKAFYLYVILKVDADRFLSVVSMLRDMPDKSIHDYLGNFRSAYQERLAKKIKLVKGKEKEKTSDALLRVKNWRSARRYSEDIVPSRINWLIDLGLIDLNSYKARNTIKLNDIGYGVLRYFRIPLDKWYIDIDDEWISTKFASFASKAIAKTNSKTWHELNSTEQNELLEESLKKCYRFFRALTLPRLSIEQTFLFSTIWLLEMHNVVAEFTDIEEWIGFERTIGDMRYGIRKAAREYESYIIISNV